MLERISPVPKPFNLHTERTVYTTLPITPVALVGVTESCVTISAWVLAYSWAEEGVLGV